MVEEAGNGAKKELERGEGGEGKEDKKDDKKGKEEEGKEKVLRGEEMERRRR